MRILHVSQSFALHDDVGSTTHVRGLAQALADRGHDVTVLTSDYQRPGAVTERRVASFRVRYLKAFTRRRAVTIDRGLFAFCRRELPAFDLVHVHGLYDMMGSTVGYYCRRYRIPYLVETMGMFKPVFRTVFLKRMYHATAAQLLIRGAAWCVVTSEQERQVLVDGGIPASKLLLRPNGVELPEPLQQFEQDVEISTIAGVTPGQRVILFLGRIARIKGIDLLMRAFARMTVPDTVLVIAGPPDEGNYDVELRSLAKKLSIEANIRFVGPVYGAQKNALLNRADVVVLPSHTENFGLVAAEAMACGTPVIVTEGCGIAPYVAAGAGLVVERNEAALHAAVDRILSDASLAKRFAERGPEIADTLSWPTQAAAMEQAYLQEVTSS